MPTYEEVMGELAAQGLGDLDPYGGAAAGSPGALADQSTYSPWERAAAAVRFGAKPLGGRQEGVATTLPQEILAVPVRAAAGFTKAAFDRAAEEHGGVPQISTDYDPRRMAGYLGAETALNTTGFGTPFAQAGALGSAGGKAVIGELASQAPPFYSAVERAVQAMPEVSMTGPQWQSKLWEPATTKRVGIRDASNRPTGEFKEVEVQARSPIPGVKPEEIQALRLGELFEQPGAVPKQAVLDQIAANRVNVGEVVKGGTDYAKVDALTTERARVRTNLNRAREQFALDPANRDIHRARVQELADHDQTLTDQIIATQGVPGQTTKFGTYTLPGGENYREMLLTLPTKKAAMSAEETNNLGRTLYETYDRRAGDPPWERISPDMHEIYRSRARQKADAAENPAAFRSSHFDEPNVLAHVRTNDRVIDGKKTLFVEEVQSDWHQAGRTKGYHDQSAVDAAEAKLRAAEDSIRAGDDNALRQFDEASRELTAAQTAMHGVPDAPFKTTWPELAMKRIIREAAEKGYDKVAWTPGSVQAARYDLSKHVKEIEYIKRGDKYELGVTDIRGSGVDMPNKAMTLEEIEETLGKEMAEKISKGEGKKYRGHEGYTLDGLDLQVGGEGMKGFYDEILPATVNKLVKKHGGRVQQGAFDRPPKLSEVGEVVPQEGGGWQIRWDDGTFSGGYGNRNNAEVALRMRAERVAKQNAEAPQTVHTIDITPSLREQAMKGFPLFTAGGVAATGAMGELARQDKYQQ